MPAETQLVPSIVDSKRRFDSWLSEQLGDELVRADLAEKDKLLRESPFVFLRGSYWRWAETILEICPSLADAPPVLAVGDIHLENFGTWRDADGRLVWGVNDFDEAAEMPYVLDLVRLATSVALAEDARKGLLPDACQAILKGYLDGIANPGAIVLDRKWQWLRDDVTVADDRRKRFWKKLDARVAEMAPAHFHGSLAAAMPAGVTEFDTARRVAGTGSLGRPRWIGVANWQGADVVREAKKILPSAWYLTRLPAPSTSRCADAANGKFRAGDPWYVARDGIVVRRLSPNNRKVEVENRSDFLLSASMHDVMGRELANVHMGNGASNDAVRDDLMKRHSKWLVSAAEQAAKFVTADFKALKKSG
ncbi:MAG TPA: DUF2252 family protein [Hyphomicrobium sp.]|nr:DUF2252 family protein [Hyphomicrobium sp.]